MRQREEVGWKVEVQVIEATKKDLTYMTATDTKIYHVAAYCRVSTDELGQKSSYESQIKYYKQKIAEHGDWKLVGIYADEAISGTQVDKRTGFQDMIKACRSGMVDIIITKSISRFARNTQDVLKYVRELQDRHIAVIFEEESINTLCMEGELLLSILSAVCQQEVENISAHVKKGLRMKMQRGELVGYAACLGFDYDVKTKKLSVNPEEAKIVRYIFKRYIEGAGAQKIAKELEAMGVKTKRGNNHWVASTVNGIIKNEKYVGNVVQGKTYTANPITKKRCKNNGEQDSYRRIDNHPAIISKDDFNLAQEIRTGRGAAQKSNEVGKITRFGRRYAFSHMIECGFCGEKYVRRNWHSGTSYAKSVWQCGKTTKEGRKNCPHSRVVSESELETAFVDSYNAINTADNSETMVIFEELMKEVITKQVNGESKGQLDSKIAAIRKKIDILLNMHLNQEIEADDYGNKYKMLREELSGLEKRKKNIDAVKSATLTPEQRLNKFKNVLVNNPNLMEFNRELFESVIKKVTIGVTRDSGERDPYIVRFEYVHGIIDEVKVQGTSKSTKPSHDNEHTMMQLQEEQATYGESSKLTDLQKSSLDSLLNNGVIDKRLYDRTAERLAKINNAMTYLPRG